jgi:hypothetical protein
MMMSRYSLKLALTALAGVLAVSAAFSSFDTVHGQTRASTGLPRAATRADDPSSRPVMMDLPLLSTSAVPSGQEPVPSAMAGVPLQVGDLPPGTIVVRLVQVTFAQRLVNHPVELHVGSTVQPLRATTNAEGRAEFSGVAVGTAVHAFAEVGGERLESQRFTVPVQGGVRLILVAGASQLRAAPANDAPRTAPYAAEETDARGVVVACLALTGAGVLLTVGRRRRAKPVAALARGSAVPPRPDYRSARDLLCDRLIDLEGRRRAGTLTVTTYEAERERVMIALEGLSRQPD